MVICQVHEVPDIALTVTQWQQVEELEKLLAVPFVTTKLHICYQNQFHYIYYQNVLCCIYKHLY